ncbi:MAG: hypothetical protein ACNA8R_10435 [Nitriliruptoraceae bacterium]
MAGTARSGTRGRKATSIGVTALALAMLTAQAAIGATGNLPGGTAIEVTIDDPAEDLVIEVEDEDELVDLTVTGTAEVGGAAVVKNTTLIYILDRSGSMTSLSGVDCTGDGSNDSRLVCQAEAVAFVNGLAADLSSPVGLTGLGAYSSGGQIYNVDRAGTSNLVAPDHDGDGNGVPDLEDTVRTITASGLTNFSAGLEQAEALLELSPYDVHRVVYISDGVANTGSNVTTFAGSFDRFGTTRIDTFAITSGSGCDEGSGGTHGSLGEVATLGTTPGTCIEVEDLSDLSFVLGTVLASELTELTGSVDGGPAVAIDSVVPALPEEGPVSVDYSWDVGALGVGVHELCVTATGSDGGGEGSVTECRTLTIALAGTEGVYPPEPEVLGEVLYPPAPPAPVAPDVLAEATPATPVAAQPDYTG